MHIAPFHFTVDNKHTSIDCLGYIGYKTSRRNKNEVRVYINFGAGGEFITSLMSADYGYLRMLATWLSSYGYDEEYLGIELDLKNLTERSFVQILNDNGAAIRFW